MIWIASVHTHYFLRRYMRTNILLDAIRTRRELKWGVPAMLLSIRYLRVASLLTVLIEDGAPGWLYMLGGVSHLERDEVRVRCVSSGTVNVLRGRLWNRAPRGAISVTV
ncbi:hypothetical protein GCM10009676_42070 [Prauserella halophila]|uniref:Uncharacterized protein n=1 Tax=Prauserella halophila TaxID=185641 RepID=A0ABN1WIM5_9PSEU|nr:hypothetical protein [Prauserella halophila]